MGLKAGIAGYGLAGSVFHAPLIAAVDGLEVAAVMTRSDERAAQARVEHPGVRVAGSLDELLEGIDLLVVATPNSAHAETAQAGLERGLHVVVDKPLAVTAADARGLAEAGDGRLTVFQNRRWDGDFLTVRRLIAEGALGTVTRLESRFERFRPAIKAGWRERGEAAEGGGVLLDLGAHLVDQAIQLFGPTVEVRGELAVRRPGAEVEDDAFVALRHAGGEVSHVWMSAVAPLHGPRFRVSGLAGGFGCDGIDPQEAQLRDGLRPGDAGFAEAPAGWIVRESGSDAHAGAREPLALEHGAYLDFYTRVREWASAGAPAPVDPLDAVRVLEVLEQARVSAAL